MRITFNSLVGIGLKSGLCVCLLLVLWGGEVRGADCTARHAAQLSERARLAGKLLPIHLRKVQQDYRELLCLEGQGEYKKAWGLQQSLSKRVPQLSGFWLWIGARLLHQQQEYEAARSTLKDALQVSPPYHVRTKVRQWLTELLLAEESGQATHQLQPGKALLDYMEVWLETLVPQPVDRTMLWQAKRLAGTQARTDLARQLNVALWRNPTQRSHAHQRLLPAGGEALLKPQDWLGRGERLLRLRLYTLLISEVDQAHAKGWLKGFDKEQRKELGGLYYGGRLRAGHKLARQGLMLLQSSKEARFAMSKEGGSVWQARLLLRLKDADSAAKLVKGMDAHAVEEWPNLARELTLLYGRLEQPVPAQTWLRRLSKHHPQYAEIAVAYWDVIWRAWQNKDWQTAHDWLQIATQHPAIVHPVTAARFTYWHGRSLQQLGKTTQAQEVWQQLLERWPYNFYSMMAKQKMAQEFPLAVWQQAKSSSPITPALSQLYAVWQIPQITAAILLDAMDEPSLARRHLLLIVADPRPPGLIREITVVLGYLQRRFTLIKLVGHQYLPQLRQQSPQSNSLWRKAFPRPHWKIIQTAAKQYQVDPFYVMAIAREESRFDPQAVSVAGARGLMQIMPATGRWLAKQLKQPYQTQQLFDPDVNISLGVYYLGQLLQQYGRSPVYAAAAYNAGSRRVNRWLKQQPTELDEFVENIPFGETRNYVRRVYLSYAVYHQVYLPKR